MLANASGYLWTAAYVNETGDLAADILADIASEQRAKVFYQNLYRQIDDQGVRETIDFLLNREEAHNTMFRQAFNKIQKSILIYLIWIVKTLIQMMFRQASILINLKQIKIEMLIIP